MSPCAANSCSMHASRLWASVTSTSQKRAPVSVVVCEPSRESMSQKVTSSPRRAKASTIARPIPWAPPVTNTRLFIGFGFFTKIVQRSPSRQIRRAFFLGRRMWTSVRLGPYGELCLLFCFVVCVLHLDPTFFVVRCILGIPLVPESGAFMCCSIRRKDDRGSCSDDVPNSPITK